MAELEALRRRIETAGDLQSVVRTMKGLAAVSIRQYEKASLAIGEYDRTVRLGLQVALRDVPAAAPPPGGPEGGSGRAGVVAFGSDQGMCGGFNEHVAEFLDEELARQGAPRGPARPVLAVGTRLAARLADAGEADLEVFGLPSSLTAVPGLVQSLAGRLQRWRVEEGVERVVVVGNRHAPGRPPAPHAERLLPMDHRWMATLRGEPWPTHVLPAHRLDGAALLAALVHEYLFVGLYRATVESLAAESAARLVAMQVAERNIDERLERLGADFHRERQMSITEELLDIVGGFEALSGAT